MSFGQLVENYTQSNEKISSLKDVKEICHKCDNFFLKLVPLNKKGYGNIHIFHTYNGQKMTKRGINRILILNSLQKGNKILYRRRVSGYGLMASDFDNNDKPLSRKIFERNCQELLQNRYIEKIEISDNKSKYYTITPLGICYLILHERKQIEYNAFRRIFIILKIFCDKSRTSKILKPIEFETDLMLNQLLKNHGENTLCENFTYSVIDCFHLFQDKYVNISFNVTLNLKLALANFTLQNRNIFFTEIIDNELAKKHLENKQFHSVFSLYVLVLFFNKFAPRLIDDPELRNFQLSKHKNTNLFSFVSSFKKHVSKELNNNQKYLQSINKIEELGNSFKVKK